MSQSTIRRTVTVGNPNGLHLVPCSLVAKIAREFACDVRLARGELVVDAKNVVELMTLGATQGTELELTAEGDGADEVANRLVELFEANFEVEPAPDD